MNTKTVISFTAGSLLAALLSFITLPLAAWLFSPEDIGRLSLLQVAIGLSLSLLSLQLHQAYVREYHEERNKTALFYAMVAPSLGITFLACIGAWLIPFHISAWLFDSPGPELLMLLILCIFSAVIINACSHVIRMEERGMAFFFSQVIPKGLPIIALLLMLSAQSARDFFDLMLTMALSYVASAIILIYLTRSSWLNHGSQLWNTLLLQQMLKFSLPLILAGFAQWGLLSSDRFFIKNYAGLHELGIYSMASAFAAAGTVLSMIFANIWHPTVYKWVKAKVPPQQIYQISNALVVIVALCWSLGAMIAGPLLARFLPTAYQGLEHIFLPCLAAPLLFILSESTMVGIGIARQSWLAVLATCCAFILSAGLNWIFVPKHGAIAAAIASMLAFFLLFIIKTEASCKVWFSFDRKRHYIVTSLYIILTTLFALEKSTGEAISNSLIWIGLFILTIILFRADIKLVYETQISATGGHS